MISGSKNGIDIAQGSNRAHGALLQTSNKTYHGYGYLGADVAFGSGAPSWQPGSYETQAVKLRSTTRLLHNYHVIFLFFNNGKDELCDSNLLLKRDTLGRL